MKRLYTIVSVQETSGGYAVILDDKLIKTAGENELVASTQALADKIVREWSEQEDQVVPDTMPLTQILSTKIDLVSQQRDAMTESVLKYLDTDLLCYPADHPPALVEMQKKAWQPWLDWFVEKFGAPLETTTGLQALSQSDEIHKKISNHIKSMGDDEFTILQMVTSLSGSIVLALAFVEGDISPEQVFECARAEENHKAALYNEEKYGPDPAQEKKDEAMKKDLEAAEVFLKTTL